jgi:uncharacterized protein YdhG (YjbR/CyaY superfamily)
MRATIRNLVPDATESIRYGIAAFHVDQPLVYIAGFKDHVSLFPTASGVRTFKKELKEFKMSTGTIQFPLDQPLPLDLIERIVLFRAKEIGAKSHKKLK